MLNGKRRKMIQRTIKLHTGVEKTLNSTKIITNIVRKKNANVSVYPFPKRAVSMDQM